MLSWLSKLCTVTSNKESKWSQLKSQLEITELLILELCSTVIIYLNTIVLILVDGKIKLAGNRGVTAELAEQTPATFCMYVGKKRVLANEDK